MAYLEKVVFFYDFRVSVASVQLNLRVIWEFFLKLTPMMVLKITLTGIVVFVGSFGGSILRTGLRGISTSR